MAGRELSGRELREQLQWRHSLDTVAALPQKGGIKDYAPDGSWLQERKLENFYSERLNILQEERVHTQESLGRGEWISSVGKVHVIKTTGKFWKNFGHSEDGKKWLYPEEALFLMDEGAMEVYWADVALSIETAYSLLLGDSIPLHQFHVFAHLCRYGYVVRRHSDGSHLTSYERAIGIGKSRHSAASRKKPKKHKLCDYEEQRLGVITKKCTRKHCDSDVRKVRTVPNACDCQTTDHETNRVTCSRHSRGWFLPSWPQSDDKSECSSSNADESMLHFPETLTKQTCSWLAELHLECSTAAKWLELKRSQREDKETLLSSPAGVLWRGNVKPLVRPSQATSVGNILKLLSIVRHVDHTSMTTNDRDAKHSEIVYDVFLPDANFRKSNPGQPAVCLCIARQEDAVPDIHDIVGLSRGCPAHTTLMWAVVDSGDVTFIAFHPVTLPADDDVVKM